jgi:cytochrome P450
LPTLTPNVVYDPFSYEMHENPYLTYKTLRDRHPVYHNAERGFWALSRYDDVQGAARDWQTFSSQPGVDLDGGGQAYGPGNFIDLDPPRHDVLRKLVRDPFIPKQVAEYEPHIASIVTGIERDLVGRTQADLAQEVAWVVPVAMICDLLGVPSRDRATLQARLNAFMFRHDGDDRLPSEAVQALEESAHYFRDLIATRRSDAGDDLVSKMVTAEVDGHRLDDDEVIAICLLLLAAGVETAAGLISSAFLVLAHHPETRTRLRSHPEIVPKAIEEILRYESPIQGLARTTARAVELHDVQLPAQARVFLIYGAANRDDRRFADPDRLDLDRDLPRTLAFGEGIHFCLGAPLARLEARVVLERLLPRLGDYEVDGPIERLHSHTTRAITALPARLDHELTG